MNLARLYASGHHAVLECGMPCAKQPEYISAKLLQDEAHRLKPACGRQACATGASGGGAFEVEDDHGDVVGLRGAAGEVAHAVAHGLGEFLCGRTGEVAQ